KIKASRVSSYPSGAVDVFPTIAEIVGLPPKAMLNPVDGESLLPLFDNEPKSRSKPLIFSSRGRMAVIDNQWKFLSQPQGEGRKLEMFDLSKDLSESKNLFRPNHPRAKKLRAILHEARQSISDSVNGMDYPEKQVDEQPPRTFWTEIPEYRKHFQDWKDRPEYKSRLRN
ncbi:MAG: N-acetylgalactosamine 6-sulfate sulfatase, partial [Verrucomicrobiota bacterium]|nr:N-acetylgalactosamine 6-sulfate sulfatase [Verrucomicrobiota bacterium]